MPAPVVRTLLHYLYTDALDYASLTPEQLPLVLVLADRWLLPLVVNHCQEYVMDHLESAGVALQWLLWADANAVTGIAGGICRKARGLVAADFKSLEGDKQVLMELFARPHLAMEITLQAMQQLWGAHQE
jgi:hypothetical protein